VCVCLFSGRAPERRCPTPPPIAPPFTRLPPNKTTNKQTKPRQRKQTNTHTENNNARKVLDVVEQAQLGVDAAAAADDAGDARRRERHVAQQHAGVDREVVDALQVLVVSLVVAVFFFVFFGWRG
jgi:hypothetical protein